MKRELIQITENKQCEYHILCAVDFYAKKGQKIITIPDVQNFIQGYTFKELSENACYLIYKEYIDGEFSRGLTNIKMYKITDIGMDYFDNI